MLEKEYQIEAYHAMKAAGGILSPAAIGLCGAANSAAVKLSSDLSKMIDSELEYPAKLKPFLNEIKGIASNFEDASATLNAHISILSKHSELSELFRLNIGWDLFLKTSGDGLDSELWISTAIADTEVSQALLSGLTVYNLEDLDNAMSSINKTLSSSSSSSSGTTREGSGSVGGSSTPEISAKQYKALEDALLALEPLSAPLYAAKQTLLTLHSKARKSIEDAYSTFDAALLVTMLDSMGSAKYVSLARNTLMPPDVAAALDNKP